VSENPKNDSMNPDEPPPFPPGFGGRKAPVPGRNQSSDKALESGNKPGAGSRPPDGPPPFPPGFGQRSPTSPVGQQCFAPYSVVARQGCPLDTPSPTETAAACSVTVGQSCPLPAPSPSGTSVPAVPSGEQITRESVMPNAQISGGGEWSGKTIVAPMVGGAIGLGAVLLLIAIFDPGFLGIKSQAYKEGYSFGYRSAAELSTISRVTGGDPEDWVEGLGDPDRIAARTGASVPYPQGSAARTEWVRGYKDGFKAGCR